MSRLLRYHPRIMRHHRVSLTLTPSCSMFFVCSKFVRPRQAVGFPGLEFRTFVTHRTRRGVEAKALDPPMPERTPEYGRQSCRDWDSIVSWSYP